MDLRSGPVRGDTAPEALAAVELPPPPPFEPPKQGWVRRTWAIVGIVGGFLFLVVPGIFAIRSYRRWRAGKVRRPIFAWTFAWFTVAYVAFVTVMVVTLPHELINVDFRERVAPFSVGQNSSGTAELVDGTYRFTVAQAGSPFIGVGRFVRTAYAVGIRAEVAELTEPGTWVGPMCLGPDPEGGQVPVGYGFFVQPGGVFSLERLGPDGSFNPLEHGTDARIETVERVSIRCSPNEVKPAFGGSTAVTVTGYVNGLEVVTTQDPDGYNTYTAAGLSVQAERAGTEVRFTRVWARLPDGEWIP